MTTRNIRRKKSSLTEMKLAVIGAPSVGKTALIVRFLTKRYIGEYDRKQENKYRHEALMEGEPILFEILDVGPMDLENVTDRDFSNWAEGMIFVYSITDRESFNYVRHAKDLLHPEIPLALFGCKADMVHLRQVSQEEGEILAKDFECTFTELAPAEQVDEVAEAFHELCHEVLALRRRNKHNIFDRMLRNRAPHRAYSRGKSDSALRDRE